MTEEEKRDEFDESSHEFFIMFSKLSDYDCQKLLNALSEMRKIRGILPMTSSIHSIFMWLCSIPEDAYQASVEDLKRERKEVRKEIFSSILQAHRKDDEDDIIH